MANNFPKNKYKVILFYKFYRIKNPKSVLKEQKIICTSLNLKGRMLIATEGINATFEGKESDIKKYKKILHSYKVFEKLVFKESEGTGKAFSRLEIKIRPEIVTLESGNIDIKRETAKNISAKELQNLYEDREDFVVLDLRNNYEISLGFFENSVHPDMEHFRELPRKIKELDHLKEKKVVAVCTGGIRCEKATCLLKREGFTNLFQLQDGIHTYIQKYPGSYFKGSLFVFDNRMTIPVADAKNREVIGRCIYCNKKCEEYWSNDTVRPSKKIISCFSCARQHSDILRRCRPL